jgi:hypothetical protein
MDREPWSGGDMATDIDGRKAPAGAPAGDTVLETLVRLADTEGLQIGITLYMGGIHLKAARPFDADGPYMGEGMWWRGRIDRVDGFHFGVIRGDSAQHPHTDRRPRRR